jgi:AmmeMemoRadiSam system protein A
MIPAADRRRLLRLARNAVIARVRGERPPVVPQDLDIPASGVFVTLHHRGELRGCLGTLDPREPVAHAVVRLAGDVTHRDHRFEPLHVEELNGLAIDVSVLTEPTPVADPSEIAVGRDGLIVEQHGRKGLLLPQVAPEHGFDRETFLAHTCLKAGLAADAWRHGAALYRFEAEVFSEAESSFSRDED